MFKRFARDTQGSVFIIVAAGIMVLVGAVGVAVDVGRGQMAQRKLQNALDAAGLAAGASINTTNLEAEVNKYMTVNFTQGTQGAVVTKVTPVLSDDGKLLTVSAEATMPTTFMNIFGNPTMELAAATEVTRSNKGMELAMVLDVTGSMCQPCTKIEALKNASHDLLEILFGEGKTTADNLWIGIVPFSMGVNVGPSHTDWLNSADYAASDWGPTSWRGCTDSRWNNGRDLTEDTPATEKFEVYYRPDQNSYNDWILNSSSSLCSNRSSCTCANYNCGCTTVGLATTCRTCTGSGNNRSCTATVSGYLIDGTHGPNRYCPVSEVTRLTNNREILEDGIDALVTDGGTHIPEGAAWGWRLLSQDWRGLWGGSMNTNNLPLNYNSDLMIKAMILMTDGENTMYTNADGSYSYLGDNRLKINPVNDANATTKLNQKLSAICTGMKAKGIVIYTVLFDETAPSVVTMMQNCASQPDYFFNSPDEATLQQAFRTIGDSLANLRISK